MSNIEILKFKFPMSWNQVISYLKTHYSTDVLGLVSIAEHITAEILP